MARIVIAGGSLGGLFAANMLVRDGHEVTLLEKVRGSLDGRGAGIVTHQALVTGLRRAGVDEGKTLGCAVASRVELDVRGDTVSEIPLPQVLTSWSRLYALLHEALPVAHYRQGTTVKAVEQTETGVAVHTEEGQIETGDLLIASDGIRSVVRGQYAPQVLPAYAGYVAWRGVCDEALLSQRTLDTAFDHFAFGLPPGEQLIGYPVAGAGNATERGRRRFNFVWYRPADEATELPALLTDADGNSYPLGIPPNKVSWRHIAAMRAASRTLLAPQFAEIMEKTYQPFLQPIYDLHSAQMAFGRVALMGDAAFVARPHVGMGVTKAAQDAMALSDAIRAHGATPAALVAFEQARLAAGQEVVQRGRRLGAYMQAQGRRQAASPADASQPLRRDNLEVLRETAVSY